MKNILLHIVILLLFSTFTNFAQLTIKDQESTPNTLLQVNDEGTAGSITLASLSSISVPTSKLYNLGGNLFWNGIALGASRASCINDLSDAISDESNVFLGQGAGTNDDGNNNNTAVGKNALNSNTYGYGNTAYGCEALFIMAAGNNNTAIGSWALLENSGNSNTAIGTDALSSNQQGNYNTAIGASSLMQNGTGSNNTSIGYNAGPLFIDGDNTTALGSGAVPTEINSVAIGNTSVTSIGGYVNWSVISDGRFKNNVSEDVAGLNFIMGLRPIIYNLNISAIVEKLGEDTRIDKNGNRVKEQPSTKILTSRSAKESIRQSGFSAQEVEELANKLGYDFSGIDKPQNEASFYGLRYAEFVVPLVKAVQEQQAMIEELRKQNSEVRTKNSELEDRLSNLESLVKTDSFTKASN